MSSKEKDKVYLGKAETIGVNIKTRCQNPHWDFFQKAKLLGLMFEKYSKTGGIIIKWHLTLDYKIQKL